MNTGGSPALRIVKSAPTFDVGGFLRSFAPRTAVAAYRPKNTIFSQGDAANSVMYLQEGVVRLSVLSRSGKEGVIAIVNGGDFFGESALTGRPLRSELATAMTAATVLVIPIQQMSRLLHEQQEFSDRFIAHTLARNIRIEQDVVDQFFNSSDKRLARALLLLAHHGKAGAKRGKLPRISQQTLADMVGTTRSRVNYFMNRFKKLGYIEYSRGLTVHDSLESIILRDERVGTPQLKTG